MKLRDACESYIRTNPRITSTKTERGYLAIVELFAAAYGGSATTARLNDDDVGAWLKTRRKRVAAETVRGEAAKLFALWRWCAKRGYCAAPTIHPPARVEVTPRALTEQQLHALWVTASRTQRRVAGVAGSLYWPPLLYLLWQTGERIGAVRSLEWRDIDLDGGWVTYRVRKGGRRQTVRAINSAAVRRLAALRRESPRPPFAEPSGSGWYYHWSALVAEAKLPEWVTPHVIRRSVASHMVSEFEAAELLGHSSVSVTRRSYRDPRVSRVRPPRRGLFDPLRRWRLFDRLRGRA